MGLNKRIIGIKVKSNKEFEKDKWLRKILAG
jgi:hypothetical protein